MLSLMHIAPPTTLHFGYSLNDPTALVDLVLHVTSHTWPTTLGACPTHPRTAVDLRRSSDVRHVGNRLPGADSAIRNTHCRSGDFQRLQWRSRQSALLNQRCELCGGSRNAVEV